MSTETHAVNPATTKQLWDQQPGESPKAFASFMQYLESGPEATLQQIAETTGKSLQAIWHLSSRHHWLERAAAWRQHLASIACAASERATNQNSALWAVRA